MVEPVDPEPATATVYRHLGGDPIEVWESSEGARVEFDPATRRLSTDPPIKVRETWRLGEPLATCLGDPLALPPAQDVGGFRKLVLQDGVGFWRIELSGRNHCRLEGVLDLSLQFAPADITGLEAHGQPWSDGGRDAVTEQLRAELMAHADANWDTLSEGDKQAVRRSLSATGEGRAFLETLD